MTQEPEIFVLQGGLDLVTQPNLIRPGFAIGAQNYESEVRGYRRSQGYEIYDGSPKPSAASYWILGFDSGSAVISAGSTVTGDTSGATGIALYATTAESGSFGGGDAAGRLIMYGVTGTFQDNEGLEVSAVNVATADGTADALSAGNDTDAATYLQAAIEATRANISAVPGEGPVRGIQSLLGTVYAFRNASGGGSLKIYEATTSGWSEVGTDSLYLAFTSGSEEPSQLDVLQGATSGATASVRRVVVTSGSFGGGDAAGYMVLGSQTGTFVAEDLDNNTTTTSNVMTISSNTSAISIAPGGKVRGKSYNFTGQANTDRLYFVTGEGRAFEFDGSTLAPIETGLSASLDKPTHVGVQSNHLVLGYAGGSVQISGTGLPLQWRSTDGALELTLGETVTGMLSSSRTAMVITGRNKISYLTGNDANDFDLSDISDDSGAKEDTLVMVNQPHFLDDLGIRSLSQSERFGDWSLGALTERIEPIFKVNASLATVGVFRVRSKNQIRLFWEDGNGISIYLGRGDAESMPIKVGFNPNVLASLEGPDGDEILLMGDDSGNVYEMDAGTSANGSEVNAFLRLAFMNMGSPNVEKRFHRALLDVAEGGGDGASISYTHDVSYGSPQKPSAPEFSQQLYGGGGIWDTSQWDNFYWDSVVQDRAILDLESIGENISIVILSAATYEQPHTLATMQINWKQRRRIR